MPLLFVSGNLIGQHLEKNRLRCFAFLSYSRLNEANHKDRVDGMSGPSHNTDCSTLTKTKNCLFSGLLKVAILDALHLGVACEATSIWVATCIHFGVALNAAQISG